MYRAVVTTTLAPCLITNIDEEFSKLLIEGRSETHRDEGRITRFTVYPIPSDILTISLHSSRSYHGVASYLTPVLFIDTTSFCGDVDCTHLKFYSTGLAEATQEAKLTLSRTDDVISISVIYTGLCKGCQRPGTIQWSRDFPTSLAINLTTTDMR